MPPSGASYEAKGAFGQVIGPPIVGHLEPGTVQDGRGWNNVKASCVRSASDRRGPLGGTVTHADRSTKGQATLVPDNTSSSVGLPVK
jgi:hypothetical protein